MTSSDLPAPSGVGGVLDSSEGIALFTDGSASVRDRSGGWGFVALDAFDGITTGSGYVEDTTVNQMELYAAVKGLNFLEGFGALEVLVYSDSEYLVLGATNRKRARRKNAHYWHWLDDAIRVHAYVEFNHVKGHNDHLFNEMADELAGKARREGLK